MLIMMMMMMINVVSHNEPDKGIMNFILFSLLSSLRNYVFIHIFSEFSQSLTTFTIFLPNLYQL